ncbi:hypothetical protein [Paraburkholderia fungorum]|uniref:hypothetical protein n=1 Tax=Paraburkholderia fungorum TaxID=134537 RepID=UPI0038BC599F
MIDPMDYEEAFSKRAPTDLVALTPKSERLFKASVIVVCGWAVIEAILELGSSIDSTLLLALVTLKVLMCIIGALAILNLPFARHAFTFFCGASVFVVAPALPHEYTRCASFALFATVECIAKAVCIASFALGSSGGGRAGDHIRSGSRTATDQE